ncbi:MAG: hypothetical protein J6T97_03645 [Bacteroidaceae bacterium]|uniref:hypothetical protein n=1 Tax=Ruminococcus sp. TaxID=41978 RepID=UPI001B0D83E1|nr:hypothetical protein [Ruminococcus sp.]MBO7436895.1 hypothetical protein [Bacteroidaceae bacterium]MBP5433265.1 hypothetical protein [Ruminococcus sp.]
MCTLQDVMTALGITGAYQADTVEPYYNDVIDYLIGAGVPSSRITTGIVARGVSDLWNYGSGDAKLSEYFLQRAAQLSLRK